MSVVPSILSGPLLLACAYKDDHTLFRAACSGAGVAMPIANAYSGTELLDYLLGHGPYADRSRHPFPSLVLADARLPVLSGFQALEQIRATPHLSFLPVILMLDTPGPAALRQARQLGASSLLLKPFNLDQLKTTIKSFADFWLTACRLPILPAPGLVP